MNKKAREKILSLLLTLCLIMGMVPMTAWAEGTTLADSVAPPVVGVTIKDLAVGLPVITTTDSTLSYGIVGKANEENIEAKNFPISDDVKLDLSSFNIASPQAGCTYDIATKVITVSTTGKVTITGDGSGNGYGVKVEKATNVTLNNAKIVAESVANDDAQNGLVLSDGVTLISTGTNSVIGGSATASGDSGGYGIAFGADNSTLNVTSGTLTATGGNGDNDGGYGLSFGHGEGSDKPCDINIAESCSLTAIGGNGGNGIFSYGGDLTINCNGILTAKGGDIDSASYSSGNAIRCYENVIFEGVPTALSICSGKNTADENRVGFAISCNESLINNTGINADIFKKNSIDPIVYPEIRTPPTIITPAGELPYGIVGKAYKESIMTVDSPTSFKVSEGELPKGLTINNDGVISGTPRTEGTSKFSITATNPAGSSDKVSYSITIDANDTDITEKITDENFKKAIYALIGKNAPDVIYKTDVKSITSLDVSNKNIKSLEGIEYFIKLEELDCSYNDLKSLDVTKNIKLKKLYCNNNKLTEIKVTGLRLARLVCNNNNMKSKEAVTGLNRPWDGIDFVFENYGLFVGGVEVTEANKANIIDTDISGNVSYDPTNKTLTLNNATIKRSDIDNAIFSADDLTVFLIGNNRLGEIPPDISDKNKYSINCGIMSKNVKLTGTGNLDIYDGSIGVVAKNVMIDMDGSLSVTEYGSARACCLKAETGSLTINKGNLHLKSYMSNALYGESSIVINGGTITAQTFGKEYYAFNTEPSFGRGNYKVFAGADVDSASFISNPTSSTYTINSYVKIESTDGGGSSGGGGGGGGSYSPPTTIIPVNNNAVSVNYTKSGNIVTLDLPSAKVTDIIAKAKDGKAMLDISKVSGTTEVALPKTALTQLAETKLGVEIKLPQGTVALDDKGLKSAATQASGTNITVLLNSVNQSSLTTAQKAVVKSDDVVFDISVMSDTQVIHDFDGIITVSVPYTGALPVAVWYLNDKGQLEKLESTYSATTKTVTFTTNHLSLYVVGQDKEETQNKPDTTWVNPFKDVKENDWYYSSVQFASQNKLFSGTSQTTFSPHASMNRAMMVTVLWRMAGSPEVDGANNFTDVLAGAWYEKAVIWAVKNNIATGVGGGMFAPETNINREQMAAMLYNYAKAMGIKLAQNRTGNFADSANISTWAMEAVNAMYGAEVLGGKGNSLFDSKGNATRAEVATMFMKFMKKTEGY